MSGGSLARPAVVLALVVLLINDHFLKAQYPGWITGKLSDVAGLFVLGAFLSWLFPRRSLAALTLAGLAFAVWKSELSTPLIAAWNQLGLLPVTRVVDGTDLLALPFLALGGRLFSQEIPASTGRIGIRTWRFRAPASDIVIALVCLLAFAATSRMYVFTLRHHGGTRTVVYQGTPAQMSEALELCGLEWHGADCEDDPIGVYVEPEPRTGGLHLRGSIRETQGRTVVIFEEAWASFQPEDESDLIDRSILTIESCLESPTESDDEEGAADSVK